MPRSPGGDTTEGTMTKRRELTCDDCYFRRAGALRAGAGGPLPDLPARRPARSSRRRSRGSCRAPTLRAAATHRLGRRCGSAGSRRREARARHGRPKLWLRIARPGRARRATRSRSCSRTRQKVHVALRLLHRDRLADLADPAQPRARDRRRDAASQLYRRRRARLTRYAPTAPAGAPRGADALVDLLGRHEAEREPRRRAAAGRRAGRSRSPCTNGTPASVARASSAAASVPSGRSSQTK